MRQIKTVVLPVEQAEEFDTRVNLLIRRGWKVKRRETLNHPEQQSPMLYAELERRV